MRMRKKPNLIPRMERCSDYLIRQPQDWRGHWREKYPKASAFHLELGCGKGRFTCETAASMPEVLFVAVERVPDAMVIAMERAKELGLTNVFFIDADVADLPSFFAPDEVDRIYVNFCDPWPTTRHAKRRLTHEDFLRLYRNVLADGGQIHFKTDNRPLFDWSVFQFPRAGYDLTEVTRNLHGEAIQGIMTDYEEKFHNLGTPINRCVGTKTDLPVPLTQHSDPRFEGLPFSPADILLPQDCDLNLWAVVACDQYTSQPEYWQRVAERVGQEPSSLHMMLPESQLHNPKVGETISEINLTMGRALQKNRFRKLDNALIYIERQVSSGHTRRGLLGVIDLEHYDYEPGSSALIRATEGTVMERIPPRVAVRKQAPIELPHVMLLMDDPTDSVMRPMSQHTQDMELLYDFDLMEDSGNIKGWLVNEADTTHISAYLRLLSNPTYFSTRYHLTEEKPTLLFAAGDGNHSLATAKECYQRQKRLVPQDRWANLPARYALVELVNLYDPAMEFEPIHRVLFNVDVPALLSDLKAAYPEAYEGTGEGHVLPYVWAEGEGAITIPKPSHQLPVGSLQSFLDDWLSSHKGSIDYVHGADVATELGTAPGNLGFLLSSMEKDQLFPTVIHDGVLPRKTFSMGEAQDKRFYLEARRIRD